METADMVFEGGQNGSGPSVLVVEDNPYDRDICKMLIEKAGFSVLVARDGEEGVQMLSANIQSVRLAIVDSRMPKMDGLEAIDAMRKVKTNLHYVLCTGFDSDDAQELFGGLPQDVQLLTKPYKKDDLLNLVWKLTQ